MLSKELLNKIKSIYGNSSDQIIFKFEEYSKREEWISHNKVLNAIIKLSKGDVTMVDKYLDIAETDPRDVIMLSDEIDEDD